jgi:hypothetical protein
VASPGRIPGSSTPVITSASLSMTTSTTEPSAISAWTLSRLSSTRSVPPPAIRLDPTSTSNGTHSNTTQRLRRRFDFCSTTSPRWLVHRNNHAENRKRHHRRAPDIEKVGQARVGVSASADTGLVRSGRCPPPARFVSSSSVRVLIGLEPPPHEGAAQSGGALPYADSPQRGEW